MNIIVNLNASLDVLGPVGLYASQEFGTSLPLLLTGVIVLWCVLPLSIAILTFRKRGGI
jgi:hypothetical protein